MRSATLTLWLCCWTNCSFIFSSSRYFLTSFEATLSMMLETGLKPLFFRCVMFYLNVAIFELSVRYLVRVANILFDNQLYSIKIDVLPSLDRIGNFPM